MAHIAHQGHLGGITLPLEIFRDPRLNGAEIKFLVALLEFRNGKTGKCNVGGAQIESVSGLVKGNQNRTLRKLVKLGWLKYTKGNHSTTNDYTFSIPPEYEAKYRSKLERLPDEEWNKRVKEKGAAIKAGKRKTNRKDKFWTGMDTEDLLAEMAQEVEEGDNYIPDRVLEDCGLVRGGDNSIESINRRRTEADYRDRPWLYHAETAGVEDMFDKEIVADATRASLLQDIADM